ncbi:TetR/AcrR family transcriptional regulator [Pseudolysinimonas sp.]|uniref:TetR/AcrR family transcriptional regulator n=1 Tax=Pseudolysinimonas sp. TaxID=2680009 RepID=UPI003F82192E
MAIPSDFVVVRVRERARPLAPEDRRNAILDAVIPLVREQGRDVSTRQMAEAAGVAEGTLFRAFGDKESILAAATEKVVDPEPFRDRLRGIDPDDPTEEKVRQVVTLFVERFSGVVRFAVAMRMQPGPPPSADEFRRSTWFTVLGQLFRPGELSVSTETFAFFVRQLAFGSAVPGAPSVPVDDLVALILRGVLPPTDPEKKG